MDDLSDAIVVEEDDAQPGHGVGHSLDFTNPRDIGLLRQAIRRGWVKSLDRMDRLIAEAEEKASHVEDADKRAILADSLARTGATAASVYARSVETADRTSRDAGTGDGQKVVEVFTKLIENRRLPAPSG